MSCWINIVSTISSLPFPKAPHPMWELSGLLDENKIRLGLLTADVAGLRPSQEAPDKVLGRDPIYSCLALSRSKRSWSFFQQSASLEKQSE